MRFSKANRVVMFAAAMVCCLPGRIAWAMTIASDAQGNMVQAGTVLTFSVGQSKGEVHYVVKDYFGKEVRAGSGATIALSGLQPGWYELVCRDEAGEASAFLGVLMDRGGKPLPRDGRIGVDTIMSGQSLAKLVRLAGMSWVRERLYWCAVQYEDKAIDWKDYPSAAKAIAAEGLSSVQVFHDFPPWVLSKDSQVRGAEDLRHVYRFARATSATFSGACDVWEMGNEPDYTWQGAGEQFAAFTKAAYWGLKDGNPKATTVSASLAHVMTPFLTQVYECGLAEYSDVFNWHSYEQWGEYGWRTAAFLNVLKSQRAGDRPMWITEDGWPLPRELTVAHQREMMQMAIRKMLAAFAAGNDKYFWFCMPDHEERGLQFNLIRRDCSPYPLFVAYSAAANILGESAYLGQYSAGAPTYVFSTPRGVVAAFWSPEAKSIEIPTDRESVVFADAFGAERRLDASGGKVCVTAGPETMYVIDVGNRIKTSLSLKMQRTSRIVAKQPSRVVISAHAALTIDEGRGCYYFATNEAAVPFDYVVDVYNFDAKARRGAIVVDVPGGWRVERKKVEVSLEPMDRQRFRFRVVPAKCSAATGLNVKIRVGGSFDQERVSLCVSYFGFDASVLHAASKPAAAAR